MQRVTADLQLAIGLDIGGTKIAGGVVDRTGRVHAELQAPTHEVGRGRHRRDPAGPGVPASGGSYIAAVGVGAAGIVPVARGRMWAPNNAYRDWAIRDELERETGLPAVVDNDANVAASPARLGKTPFRQMLFLTVGTGIGGGLVLDGEIYRGPTGTSSAPVVDPLGPRCGCGLHGCLEAVSSGTALTRMGREAAAADPDGLIAGIGRTDGVVTGHTVTAAAGRPGGAGPVRPARAGSASASPRWPRFSSWTPWSAVASSARATC